MNWTVQEKLHVWMVKHNSKQWSVGCHLVQWQISTQFHHTVQIVPYVLTFGQKPRVGISDLPLDKTVISNLETQLNMVADVNNNREKMINSGANNENHDNDDEDHMTGSVFDVGSVLDEGHA